MRYLNLTKYYCNNIKVQWKVKINIVEISAGAASIGRVGDLGPALRFHQLAPPRVEATLVVLACGVRHDADQAGQPEAVILELARGAAEPHLVVVRMLARDSAAAGRVRVVPVLHVILLGES